MKVVVIGGRGYIGRRLCSHLRDDGFSVSVVDLAADSEHSCDYIGMTSAFWNGFDAIVLLAGYSSVAACKDPTNTFRNNFNRFLHLTNSTKSRIIYASSSSVYGHTNGEVATENYDRYRPSNYYDLSKKLIDLYAEIKKGPLYGLRLGTVCGGSPNLRVDLMINKMFHDAKTKGKITIYNPSSRRPILGMSDLCRAISRMITLGGDPGLYNLSSLNISVLDIAKAVSFALGEIEIETAGDSQTYDFAISTKKFEDAYNFKFEDTIPSIISDLKKTYNSAIKGVRG